MRKAGESIHIGPNIVVTLVALDRNRARIGITAPRHIAVDREEIAKKKRLDLQGRTDGESTDDDRAENDPTESDPG